jgi:hypothetical protein
MLCVQKNKRRPSPRASALSGSYSHVHGYEHEAEQSTRFWPRGQRVGATTAVATRALRVSRHEQLSPHGDSREDIEGTRCNEFVHALGMPGQA